MENVFSICKYFVDRGKMEGKPVSNITLQKLLYFAQGIYLAANDELLFQDEIYAWEYGPVVKTVYNECKIFGNNSLTLYNSGSIVFRAKAVSEEVKSFLDIIWRAFGKYSAFELVELTHVKGSPWHEIFERFHGIIPFDYEIKPESMKPYFKKYLRES